LKLDRRQRGPRARAGILQWDEQRNLERAEREPTAVDEPTLQVGVRAGMEAVGCAKAQAAQTRSPGCKFAQTLFDSAA
jgi:hypothetical protein